MTNVLQRPATLFIAGAVISVAAVGAALISQHLFGMEPCPWCILQRVIFLAIAWACLIGLAARKAGAALVLLLSLCGAASALWQHFKAAESVSCAMTLADQIVIALKLDSMWPDVFLARASCADAAVNLFGIPYDVYSLALFILLGALGIRLLRSP